MSPTATKRRHSLLSLGSFTSGGLRRSARLSMKARKYSRKIYVCNDIWLHIFPWLNPAKVGLELALLSVRFDCLVATHLKTRKWAARRMSIFYSKENGGGASLRRLFEDLPVDQLPLPCNLIGFKSISIDYFDHSVLSWLHCLKTFFKIGITLKHMGDDMRNQRSWGLFIHKILPLIGIPNIHKLFVSVGGARRLRGLLTSTSATFLIECPNLRSIYYDSYDDADHTPFGATTKVREWLLWPRADGRPKVLYHSFCYDISDEYKQKFLSATSSVNFIICFTSFCIDEQPAEPDDVELFQLDNERTNERLALERIVLDQQSKVCMTRAPIGRDERKWAEWMRKAWEEEKPHNLIEFMIFERNIGPDI